MIHSFSLVALGELLADETRHHAAHPLLANDSITSIVHGDVVLEVDTLVRRRHGGLLSQESGGLGGRHGFDSC